MYGLEKVKAFVEGRVEVGFHPTREETSTVAAAARALSVKEDQVIKSLVFLVEDRSYLIIANGNRRVSERKLAALLSVARKRVKLAPGMWPCKLPGMRVGSCPPSVTKKSPHPGGCGGLDPRKGLRGDG